MSPDPFPAAPLPTAVPMPKPQAAPPAAVIHRDEIIDARSRIAGYRFTGRRLDSGRQPDAATRLDLLGQEGINKLAERRLALIPIAGQDWTSHDHRPLVASGTAFLLSPPDPGVAPEAWLSVLADIRESGAKLALTSAVDLPAALGLADLVVIDLAAYEVEGFEQAVARLRSQYPSLQLLAENVQSWPEHRFCLARGIHYCLGEFAATGDAEDSREKLNQSRLVLIEMLNLLRSEADGDVIADVAKRDPTVAVKVVAMANSPAAGLSSPVASIDQAILVLGRAHLYRWLTISLFRAGGSAHDETLLEMALRRARFLEILGLERFGKQEADELFLVGLLSLIDILLGLTMDKVIGHLQLPESVTRVLIGSEGPYGRYLLLAIALERGRMEQVEKLAGLLGTDAEAIQSAGAAARQWAEEALDFG